MAPRCLAVVRRPDHMCRRPSSLRRTPPQRVCSQVTCWHSLHVILCRRKECEYLEVLPLSPWAPWARPHFGGQGSEERGCFLRLLWGRGWRNAALPLWVLAGSFNGTPSAYSDGNLPQASLSVINYRLPFSKYVFKRTTQSYLCLVCAVSHATG